MVQSSHSHNEVIFDLINKNTDPRSVTLFMDTEGKQPTQLTKIKRKLKSDLDD